MPPSSFADSLDLRDLRLDTARVLVAQAVGSVPPAPPLVSAASYLQELLDTLCDLSLRDPLTGLLNRRHLLQVLESEMDRVTRSGEDALLLLLDIDNFKRINDTYGHPVGDQVLRAVAHALSACIRPMDTLARYGGEEFALILPSCPSMLGYSAAERIRRAVESTSISLHGHSELQVTVSVGGAFSMPWARTASSVWLKRADAQLYRAKEAGRNCTVIEAIPDSTVSADEKGMLFSSLFPSGEWDDSAESLNAPEGAFDASARK